MTDVQRPLNSIRAHFSALLLVLLCGTNASAQVALAYLDFDGTIVENRQSQGGTYSTTHVLFRVQEAGIHLLAGVSPGIETLEVTQQDFHRIQQYLADGHAQLGAINRSASLEDGRVIKPGFYFPRFPETFKYFRESYEPGRNYLLEDFKKAEAKSPNGEFKGRYWNVFSAWCADKSTAQRFTILTARGHSAAEWKQLFDYMIEKGYIKFAPGRVINLNRPEFDRLGLPNDTPSRKANFLAEQAAELARVDLPRGQNHSMIIADDDQKNLDRIADRLTSLSNSAQYPVEFRLANAGLRSEVRVSDRPEYATIRPAGSFKPAQLEHFFPDNHPPSTEGSQSGTPPASSSLSLYSRCEGLFINTKTGVRP